MCLDISNRKGLIAEHDIICYKVLKPFYTSWDELEHGTYKLETPYCGQILPRRRNKIIGYKHRPGFFSKPNISKISFPSYEGVQRYSLEGGAIHAYYNFDTLLSVHKNIWCRYKGDHMYDTDYIFFKCKIPKGTRYWIDDNNAFCASRCIQYLNEIKLNENEYAVNYFISTVGELPERPNLPSRNSGTKHDTHSNSNRKKRKRAAKKR